MTESLQKQKRSFPMRARINKIPITYTPKKKYTCEEKRIRRDHHRKYYKTNVAYKEQSKLNAREWAAKPENKMKRNVRQRLRRYKEKLAVELPIIWTNRGLIS